MFKKNYFIFSYPYVLFVVLSTHFLIAETPLVSIFSQNNSVDEYSSETYIYLNQDLINVINEILEFNAVVDEFNSPLFELVKHIEKGFCVARYNAVIEILDCAETTLQLHRDKFESTKFEKISARLGHIIDQVISGSLTIDEKFQAVISQTSRAPLKTRIFDKNIIIKGKSTFNRYVKTKEDMHILGKLKINKSAIFKDDVKINGTLSASDITVENLTVTGAVLSANSLNIQNRCVNCNATLKNIRTNENEIKKQNQIIEELKQDAYEHNLMIKSILERINVLERCN